jgi:hypothetical protein
MADDDIREGKSKRPKAPPRDDEDDERPRKKRRDADDEEGSDLGSSALSAVVPVGGSIFALASLWLSVIAFLLTIAGMVFFWQNILSVVLPIPWVLSLLCGVISFFTAKHKASYGSITGNMRAVLGILMSLVVMAMHGFLVFVLFSGPNAFR